jgi:hypothetical protein
VVATSAPAAEEVVEEVAATSAPAAAEVVATPAPAVKAAPPATLEPAKKKQKVRDAAAGPR